MQIIVFLQMTAKATALSAVAFVVFKFLDMDVICNYAKTVIKQFKIFAVCKVLQ
jgi:hypothetical protein